MSLTSRKLLLWKFLFNLSREQASPRYANRYRQLASLSYVYRSRQQACHRSIYLSRTSVNGTRKRALKSNEHDLQKLKLPPHQRPRGRPRKAKNLDRYKLTPKAFPRITLCEKTISMLTNLALINNSLIKQLHFYL